MHKGPAMASDISNNIASWSTTDASNQPDNTDVLGPNILAENLRAIQSAIRADSAASNSIASASTTDLSTLREGVITVTGVTTITAFGTVAAGVRKWIVFSGALTLTHNATSLILPGAANITTAAGDACCMLSLGSGNWRCLAYSRASGTALVTGGASFQAPDGSLGAPSYTYTNETTLGWYRYGSARFAATSSAASTEPPILVNLGSGLGAGDSALLVENRTSIGTNGGLIRAENPSAASSSPNNMLTLENKRSGDNCAGAMLSIRGAAPGDANLAIGVTSNTAGSADAEFKVTMAGAVSSDGGTAMTTPADYAEMFEWEDGNPGNEDRVGFSVALVGEKIKIAEAGEDPIGVVSGNPAVLADSGETRWVDKYLRDEFNRQIVDVNGRRVLNPDYDESHVYVPRSCRPEWSPVGLVGKLRLRKGQQVASTWRKMRDISESVEEWLVK